MANYATYINSFIPFVIDVASLASVCDIAENKQAEYNAKIAERIARRKATLKRYRDNNKAKIQEYSKQNRQIFNDANKRYRERHRAEILARQRKRYAERKEEINARRREWERLNRAHITALRRERRRRAKEQAQQCNEQQHINANNAGLSSSTS